jgi:hypothetical protein
MSNDEAMEEHTFKISGPGRCKATRDRGLPNEVGAACPPRYGRTTVVDS